jgi:hypothetical protein
MPVDARPFNNPGGHVMPVCIEVPDGMNRIPVLAERISACVMDA